MFGIKLIQTVFPLFSFYLFIIIIVIIIIFGNFDVLFSVGHDLCTWYKI